MVLSGAARKALKDGTDSERLEETKDFYLEEYFERKKAVTDRNSSFKQAHGKAHCPLRFSVSGHLKGIARLLSTKPRPKPAAAPAGPRPGSEARDWPSAREGGQRRLAKRAAPPAPSPGISWKRPWGGRPGIGWEPGRAG